MLPDMCSIYKYEGVRNVILSIIKRSVTECSIAGHLTEKFTTEKFRNGVIYYEMYVLVQNKHGLIIL